MYVFFKVSEMFFDFSENVTYLIKKGGAKSRFLDKGLPVTWPPMDHMT